MQDCVKDLLYIQFLVNNKENSEYKLTIDLGRPAPIGFKVRGAAKKKKKLSSTNDFLASMKNVDPV